MQKHALHNEEMKTIINILIISDTSKDFFICFNFFFIEAMLCRRRYLTLHIYFAAVFGAGFCGIFWCFFFFANAQNFAVLIKTRYFCRISSLANSLSVHEQNPLDPCN